jgi:hypothetical protein
MKQRERIEAEQPVGIVIANGPRGDVTPRFAAFVWAPFPETVTDDESLDAKAA